MSPAFLLARRIVQLFVGLFAYGIGISLMVQAGIGVAPWDVLTQGISKQTGLDFGLLTNIIGVAVLLCWIPIRQRPGIGTVANVLLIGPSAQLGLWLFPKQHLLGLQLVFFVVGLVVIALATGLYIGARMGPGPRDGLMTGIHARPFLGVAPTHKPVVIKGLTLLWTSDSGIISDLHVYFDEELIRAQLGGGPAELQKLVTPLADSEAHQTYERSGAPQEATNVALARAMIQALEDGQETSFLATFDDKLEITSLDHAEPARGKIAARQYFQSMRSSIRHLDTVVQNAWGVGSFAVVEYAITGLQQAPLPRIPFAAGRPLHTQFVDIVEIKDGRMAHIWRYADPIAFASL